MFGNKPEETKVEPVKVEPVKVEKQTPAPVVDVKEERIKNINKY